MASDEPDLTRRAARLPGRALSLPSCTLTVLDGRDAGRTLTIEGRALSIGKDRTCDLRIADASVSRRHAAITPSPQGFLIEDLGSTNGTEVNDLVVKAALLTPGCTIRLGDVRLKFESASRELPVAEQAADRLEALVGSAPPMQRLYALIRQIAPTEATVVLHGETGTGKEVAARALHALSPRHARPFVVVDCTNLDRELITTELFGHRKGAFTGAVQAHRGAFERADGGTLFLDEIGELPAELQARLLGVLQRREVMPVGGDEPRPVDVRVLAATHRDLEAMSLSGAFREDLYFRLAVFTLEVPALRDRRADLPALAAHLLVTLAQGRPVPALSPAALASLAAHPWRGNVRELGNVLHRALVLAGAGPVEPDHLQLRGAPVEPSKPVELPGRGPTLATAERDLIRQALDRNAGNLVRTAKELGIARSTLKRKLIEHNLK